MSHSVEIEPVCDGILSPNNVCNKCGLMPSDLVINDSEQKVDFAILNDLQHAYLEKLCDRLPQLLMFSTPYFSECNRRGAWVSYHNSVFDMVHTPSVVFMTSEVLAPFEKDMVEGPVNVKELLASYNPRDSVVIWIRTENRDVDQEENVDALKMKSEDAEINGAVGLHNPEVDEHEFLEDEGVCSCQLPEELKQKDSQEKYSPSYSLACIANIQAVAEKKRKRHEAANK